MLSPNTNEKSASISGIVITHSECEIIAIEAPVSASPPYASGNTTVLSPRGVARIKKRYKRGVLSIVSEKIRFASSFIPKTQVSITMGIFDVNVK